jgi:hypothetical protein
MDGKLYRLILAGLISVAPCALSFAQTTTGASGLSMEVLARVRLGSGESTPIRVTDEGTLRTGDGLQIRLKVQRDAYVYVIAYGSSQSGLLLHPFSGNDVDAFVRAGEERVIPGPGRYLPLDRQLGRESIYAVATQSPATTLSSLLVRMEAHGDDRAAIMATVQSSFPELTGVSFHHVDNAPLVGVPSSARSAGATGSAAPLGQPGGSAATSPIVSGTGAAAGATSETGATVFGSYEEPGVLSAEGSRIAAAVDGIEPPPAPRRATGTAADQATAPESAFEVTQPAAAPEPEPSGKSPGLASRLGRLFGFGRRSEEASSADGGTDTPEPAAGSEPAPATTFALPAAGAPSDGDLALSADAGSGTDRGETAVAPLDLPPRRPDTGRQRRRMGAIPHPRS